MKFVFCFQVEKKIAFLLTLAFCNFCFLLLPLVINGYAMQRSSMDDIDDDDDDEDLDMRDATPEPDELDEEIAESDLELEGDIVQSDHDDPPQKVINLCRHQSWPHLLMLAIPCPFYYLYKLQGTCFLLWQMGDPSIEVTEENRDASQEAKGKAMEAMSEGTHVFPHPSFFFSGLVTAWVVFDSPIYVS